MNRIAYLLSLLVVTLAATAVARADSSAAAAQANERRTPIVRAVERCGPAVVNISTRRETVETDPFFLGLPDIFLKNIPPEARERRRVTQSLGSGVLIHEDGYIVTNAHVVQAGGAIKVMLADKREFDATLVSADPDNDLAIVKIGDKKPFPAAQLGSSSDLMIGETVIAIGDPFGYANTVSAGIVSAVGRTLDFEGGTTYTGLIQTDAAINPGNSGGALLNINGEVIGINVAVRADAEGLGFAIPVDRVRDDLTHLLNIRNLKRLWLGANVAEDRQKDGAGAWRCTVRIGDVEPGSPAAAGGLKSGDVLAQIGPQAVRSLIDFETALLRHEVGDEITLKIRRGGDEKAVIVKLGRAPVPDGAKLALGRMGLHVQALTKEVAAKFRTAVDYGLIVTGVDGDSPGATAGFKAGDVIVQANTHRLGDTGELGLVLAGIDENAKVVLRVVRGRYVVRVAVPVRGKPDMHH